MRRLILLVVMAILFFFNPSVVQAVDEMKPTNEESLSEDPTFIDRQIERLQLDEIQQYWEQVSTEYGGFLPESQRVHLENL